MDSELNQQREREGWKATPIKWSHTHWYLPYIFPSSDNIIFLRPQGGYIASASWKACSISGAHTPVQWNNESRKECWKLKAKKVRYIIDTRKQGLEPFNTYTFLQNAMDTNKIPPTNSNYMYTCNKRDGRSYIIHNLNGILCMLCHFSFVFSTFSVTTYVSLPTITRGGSSVSSRGIVAGRGALGGQWCVRC